MVRSVVGGVATWDLVDGNAFRDAWDAGGLDHFADPCLGGGGDSRVLAQMFLGQLLDGAVRIRDDLVGVRLVIPGTRGLLSRFRWTLV